MTALEMVAALRREGVDAAVLATNDNGPGLLADLPLGRWCFHAGVPVLAFARWSPPVASLREFALAPALTAWLLRHISDYDLIHVHAMFSYCSTSTMALARQRKVPYVLTTIGQLCHWSLARSRRRKSWMLRLIERRNLEGAAALHFATRVEQEEASALGLSTPSMIIPLGVDLPPGMDLRPLVEPSGPTRFLFLSRIHPKKQLEFLLDALALLQRRHPEAAWELRIAGDGEPGYLAALRQRGDQLGIGHRCRWLGFLSGQAKWQELAQADWFVLPSASENFCVAAIEALAAGTPSILSAEVAVAESITQAGAGFTCSIEAEPLAGQLFEALSGPTACMRSAARSLAQRYGWSAIAVSLHRSYAEILAGRGPLADEAAGNTPRSPRRASQ